MSGHEELNQVQAAAADLWREDDAPSSLAAAYSHGQVIALRTGKEADFQKWSEAKLRNKRLADQTENLAKLLESEGISARRNSDIAMVGLVTGEVIPMGDYRPVRFLPLVAQRERRPIKNALEFFLSQKNRYGKYTRYLVISSGVATPAFGDFKKRHQKHARDISRLAHESDKEFGVEFIGRFTEYTRKQRGNDVLHSYNQHSNVLICPRQKLTKQRWKEFLAWLHREIPNVSIRDNGRIESVEEIVKYMIKPDDLEDITSAETAWLFEETMKCRFTAPMGGFRDFVRQSHDQRIKYIRDPKNPKRLAPVEKEVRHKKEDKPLTTTPKTIEQHILGTTTPQPIATPWTEPYVIIQNIKEARSAATRYRLEVMQTAARRLWNQAGAPAPAKALEIASAAIHGRTISLGKARRRRAFNLDTCSVTVPGSAPNQASTPPPNIENPPDADAA
ncbi:hypothetical protein [Lactobacillus amylolyticus]|uniref:hypothetical protein n=1 Tax=Lactobacillus amylolyticus TaxID=83683 RepID=UPI002492DEF8|nr:hypothetical protein [Lactobacillus amylolyticus]